MMKNTNSLAVRAAMEKMASQSRSEYFTGGQDIMKEWQAQHTAPKNRSKAKGYVTDGFSIMRKWQKQHGVKGKKPNEAFEGGFDIMKKWQKEQHSGKK